MDLLANYDSNEESSDNNNNHDDTNDNDDTTAATSNNKQQELLLEPKVSRSDRRYLQAAPAISILTKQKKHGHELLTMVHHRASSGGGSMLITEEPLQGPQAMDPAAQQFKVGQAQHNVRDIDERSFKKQRTNFQRDGKAVAITVAGDGGDNNNNNNTTTTTTTIVRTTLGYNPTRLQQFEKLERERQARPDFTTTTTTSGKNKKEKEPLVYGSDDEAVYGIWAPPSQQEQWHAEQTLTDMEKVGGDIDQLQPEQIAEREYLKEKDRILGKQQEETEQLSGFERLMERKMAHLLPPKMDGDNESGPLEPSTTFHGPAETDYKGNSWMAPPSGLASIVSGATSLEPDHHQCFVPKKCVHRFTGHNKGVQKIRLFPKTGHLLLSAGLDGKCKIWSTTTTNSNKQVMRTYEGHRAAVRDVQFNHDGSRFVSASFDRYLRLWDTESGTVLQTFLSNKRAVPYCVEFYPHDDNLFVVGGSDNKIVTYDCTTGEMTQEYNHHLAPVNAIVFCHDTDGSTKMVSSSDDKKVLVWEWDIGVPVKYISDPTMHSMPCLVMHPAQQYFVAQSLDNTICVFQANNRFALQKKKKFSGHQVAGYACEPAFSPDGQFLISGDGKGKLFIWDWKRSKILQKYKAHDKGPAIDCVWHPLEPSVLFTCGWDGVIKMWQ